jgi:ergothioneine biosynthesis protein EgtB
MQSGSANRPLGHDTSAATETARFQAVRARTVALAAPLSPEDCAAQSMPDASPAKWHLAHTTWFFEQFVLLPQAPEYRAFDPQFAYLFNSYYESVGPRHSRPMRGLLTRPSLDEVLQYRRHVDEAVARLLTGGLDAAAAGLVELGLQHEQQHQELLLMDVKHLLSCNPLKPAYTDKESAPDALPTAGAGTLAFREHPPGIYEIGYGGHNDDNSFHFDNEGPRHRVYVESFALAERLVTNREYLQFIRDRGYERPELWLSDGWATVQREGWTRPLYWDESLDAQFTLSGIRALDPLAPVCHVSFYEADAFARWAGARLPTEAEWEVASGSFHWGDAWEHTNSAYLPYPGYKPAPGAVAEYNGKFMVNQMVLRGGSRFTPPGHARATYRNFFYPHMRWQLAGIRLAKELS